MEKEKQESILDTLSSPNFDPVEEAKLAELDRIKKGEITVIRK